MMRCVIFANIVTDGIGDFMHFSDIVGALRRNSKFHNTQMTCVISIVRLLTIISATNFSKIRDMVHDRLKSLGIDYYIVVDQPDESLQERLRQADQAIVVSYGLIDGACEPYLKKDIPIKFIGEHEVKKPIDLTSFYQCKSLGLSPGCYGIKIEDIAHLEPDEAWQVIDTHDHAFLKILSDVTGSHDFNSFNNHHMLIPSYFSDTVNFLRFIILLMCSSYFRENKNMVIYLSGINLIKSFYEDDAVDDRRIARWFKATNIKEIKNIGPNGVSTIIPINAEGERTISVFSGFYLTNESYRAIYQLSKIAGVSGDNSLELCIATGVLPYYWSTNAQYKWPTLAILRKMTQLPELLISEEARKGYYMFFHPFKYFLSITVQKLDVELQEIFTNNSDQYSNFDRVLNFDAMIADWPIVIEYLKKNYNFYSRLEEIMLDGVTPEAQKASTDAVPLGPISSGSKQVLFQPGQQSVDEGVIARSDTYSW